MDLKQLTKEVVKKYLDEKVELNEGIKEVSKREKLNENMIRRLVESANTETRLHFYRQPGINQAAALFPVADADVILNELLGECQEEDIAEDYLIPPKREITIVSVQKDDKPPVTVIKKASRNELLKKQAYLEYRYDQFRRDREEFFKEARAYIMDKKKPEDINKMAAAIDGQQGLRDVFETLVEYLQNYNMHKEAAEIEKYIAKDLPAKFLVQEHPLVKKYRKMLASKDVVVDVLRG